MKYFCLNGNYICTFENVFFFDISQLIMLIIYKYIVFINQSVQKYYMWQHKTEFTYIGI